MVVDERTGSVCSETAHLARIATPCHATHSTGGANFFIFSHSLPSCLIDRSRLCRQQVSFMDGAETEAVEATPQTQRPTPVATVLPGTPYPTYVGKLRPRQPPPIFHHHHHEHDHKDLAQKFFVVVFLSPPNRHPIPSRKIPGLRGHGRLVLLVARPFAARMD